MTRDVNVKCLLKLRRVFSLIMTFRNVINIIKFISFYLVISFFFFVYIDHVYTQKQNFSHEDRKENRLTVASCQHCLSDRILCWVKDHFRRCAKCAELRQIVRECDVNLVKFKVISHMIAQSINSFAFNVIFVTSTKKRLIQLR